MHDALFVYEFFRSKRYLKGYAEQARPSVTSLSTRSFNATENTAEDTAISRIDCKGEHFKTLACSRSKKKSQAIY